MYIHNPRQVSIHLEALYPGWESIVNFRDLSLATATYNKNDTPSLSSGDEKLITYVDEVLNNLAQDGNDAMDRFRELARRHPVLVLTRFPKKLLELVGSISLTRIYLNISLFQNVR